MPDLSQPDRIERGEPISASWLNQIVAAVLTRITIIGGIATRVGSSLCIKVDPSHGGIPPVYKAIADPVGGTIDVKAVNADGTTTGATITLKVLP